MRPGGGALQLLGRLKEKPVALEEARAADVGDRLEPGLVRLEGMNELGRRRGCELRRRSFDHGFDQIEAAECALERKLVPAPFDVRRQERIDVGIQAEMGDRIDRAGGGEHECGRDHQPCMRKAVCDDCGERARNGGSGARLALRPSGSGRRISELIGQWKARILSSGTSALGQFAPASSRRGARTRIRRAAGRRAGSPAPSDPWF